MAAMVRAGKAALLGVAIAGLASGAAGQPRARTALPAPPSAVPAPAASGASGGPEIVDPAASRIRPADRLDVRVLYEPDLSTAGTRVDAEGFVSLPMVGDIRAAGLTPGGLADQISLRLSRYVKEPHVSVSVLSTAGDHVVVDGSVTDPGVFDIAGSAGLLEVLARAKGPTRTAALSQVVVFRQVDGRRVGAVFNVNRIRKGLDAEPRVYAGDTVVVGFSFVKGVYRDFLSVAPAAISIFRFY